MSRELIVATGDRVVGLASQEGDSFSFRYDDRWIRYSDSFDLSPNLRRLKEIHTGQEVKNFFENLLPEEKNRREIAATNKVDEKDIFSLLELSGRDTAGALQVYSVDDFNNLSYDPIKSKEMEISELAGEIKKNGTAFNYITSIGLKPSLSGAQDKIACRYDVESGVISFPIQGGATTHILKPSTKAQDIKHKMLEDSALNEFISLRLAKIVLGNIPETYFYESKDRDLFVIERYDRTGLGNDISRVHQFDFCQYFGIQSTEKYEVSHVGGSKGAYGIKEVLEAIRDISEESAQDAERLLDWVVFCYLIDNTDGHLKNISMIATDSGFKLAPFYDITSVGYYRFKNTLLFDGHYAFDIGGMSNMNQICDIQWRKFAEHLGLSSDYFLQKIVSLATEISINIKNVYAQVEDEISDPKKRERAQKILKYIGSSTEEKANRSLANTNLKTKKTECRFCKKKLPKKNALDIGPECFRKLNV